MRVKIRKWIGRFGNNFAQLRNSIQIAFYHGYHSVIFPKHEFLKRTRILINKDNKNTELFFDDNEYFGHPEIKYINSRLSSHDQDRITKIIQDNFTIELDKIKPLEDDELVIHIRSGDIFGNNPHPAYVLPPYSYLKNILDSEQFKTFYLVSEDTNNPLIKKNTR